MPELPDVEIYKIYMNSTSLHQKIENAEVLEPSLLGQVSSRSLQMRLKNREFEEVRRHGKYLFSKMDKNEWLILHFGMTGFLKYYKNEEQAPGHIRLLIHFDNGYHLAYDCQRKLGLIDLTANPKDFIEKKKLGIDPFGPDFNQSKFRELLNGRRGAIKSALMNQQIMAGIGNIYSDEILFHAGIHPASPVKKLKEADFEKIYREISTVLQTAIDCRVNPDNFPNDYLLPNRREKEDCPQCGGTIQKETISGRSAYFCSRHQKKI
ncbi:MAG: DNA-formamidopyrimidine glycosylase family protein [Calditrichia bacterium]